MRAKTNISLKDRLTFNIEFNRGVDLSSAPQKIASSRASHMRNMINDYGITRKRNGWNEEYKFDGRINGIFEYRRGNYNVLLIHAGRKIYRYRDGIAEDITGSRLLADRRSQCFFGKERLYIIGCVDYLVYGTWDDGITYELRAVADDEDTYIPTTTVSIGSMNDEADKRAFFEAPNILCKRRKNQLTGYTSAGNYYKLDAGVEPGTVVEVTIRSKVKKSDGEYETREIRLINAEWNSDKTPPKAYLIVSYSSEGYNGGNNYGTVNADGILELFYVNTPVIDGQDNIFVTFTPKYEDGSSELINLTSAQEFIKKASFGTLFGADGYSNRLFLSGCSTQPNKEYYSAAADLTYFPDINYTYLGIDDVPIKGYCRLSDSTLAIFKEANRRESTIFFREGKFVAKDTSNEYGMTLYDEIFTVKAGAIGEGLVSTYATANFAGDHLMLSKNGLFGIVLGNNVATAERYARERSRLINKELCQHDLTSSVGIVFNDRYYLSVDDVCYVADARYRTSADDDIDGSFNYEWWYWDNVPARIWAVVGDDLWFGTPNGQICVFDKEFTDRTYVEPEEASFSIQANDDDIVYNTSLNKYVIEGRKIRLSGKSNSKDIFSYLSTTSQASWNEEYNSTVFTVECSKIAVGDYIYLDNFPTGTLLEVGTPYKVTDVWYDNDAIAIEGCHLGESFVPEREDIAFEARIYRKISDKDLYIHVDPNVDDAFYVRESPKGENVVFSAYNGTETTSLSVRFEIASPIVAEWHTPYLDMGTNVFSKTLLKTTVSAMNVQNGNLRFGYETRSEIADHEVKSHGLDYFSLNDLSFENFAFEKDFIRSYTKRFNERNFNYIKFHFISDGAADCALYDFTATYKINKANKGVR